MLASFSDWLLPSVSFPKSTCLERKGEATCFLVSQRVGIPYTVLGDTEQWGGLYCSTALFLLSTSPSLIGFWCTPSTEFTATWAAEWHLLISFHYLPMLPYSPPWFFFCCSLLAHKPDSRPPLTSSSWLFFCTASSLYFFTFFLHLTPHSLSNSLTLITSNKP